MKAFKFLVITGILFSAFTLCAQVPATTPTTTPVAPKVIKKLPEKQQAMYDLMASELQLTDDQKTKAIELAMERALTLNEKMKTATSDEQKKELKKESSVDYNKKLDDAFGVELAGKLKNWQREYTLKQKALQTK